MDAHRASQENITDASFRKSIIVTNLFLKLFALFVLKSAA